LLPRGLVLVTGPTGSGKSTTLAAMVDNINRRRAAHIVTIDKYTDLSGLDKVEETVTTTTLAAGAQKDRSLPNSRFNMAISMHSACTAQVPACV
jgi:excinuclease UvrABC ATPase subunit